MIKILAFAGSTRQDSYNHAVISSLESALVKTQFNDAGINKNDISITTIRLSDYPLPLFCEDYEREHGTPESAYQLKELFMSHDAFVIASPEYNSSYPAVLKNAIDWISRKGPDERPLQPFEGKPALIISASTGALGGQRVLVTLRMLLANLRMWVLPQHMAIGHVDQKIDIKSGQLNDDETLKTLSDLLNQLAVLTDQLTR